MRRLLLARVNRCRRRLRRATDIIAGRRFAGSHLWAIGFCPMLLIPTAEPGCVPEDLEVNRTLPAPVPSQGNRLNLRLTERTTSFYYLDPQ